jgi:hypothetical protein
MPSLTQSIGGWVAARQHEIVKFGGGRSRDWLGEVGGGVGVEVGDFGGDRDWTKLE